MALDPTCPECSAKMTCVEQRREVFTPDPDMTDGQLAELHAANMGGPFEEGVHGTTFYRFECKECGFEVAQG